MPTIDSGHEMSVLNIALQMIPVRRMNVPCTFCKVDEFTLYRYEHLTGLPPDMGNAPGSNCTSCCVALAKKGFHACCVAQSLD